MGNYFFSQDLIFVIFDLKMYHILFRFVWNWEISEVSEENLTMITNLIGRHIIAAVTNFINNFVQCKAELRYFKLISTLSRKNIGTYIANPNSREREVCGLSVSI